MTFNFKLPDIGEGVAEGEITRWLVKEGDLVKEDQPMVEVMTDKATVEITSPKSGRIQKILYPEGSVAPVHEVIVVIDEDGAGAAPAAAPAATAKPAAPAPPAARPSASPQPPPVQPPKPRAAPPPPPPQPKAPPRPIAPPPAARPAAQKDPVEEVPTRPSPPAPSPGTMTPYARAGVPPQGSAPLRAEPANGAATAVLATPATRRLARELGVDLGRVAGTGPRGRVLKIDVEAAAGSHPAAPAPAAAPADDEPQVARAVEHYEAPAVSTQPAGSDERIPYRGLRRAIGEQMVKSFFTAPHFTLVDEIDFTEVDAIRKAAKDDAEAAGTKLTYLPFVMKALCAAIRKYPTINASLDEEKGELVVKREIHIGFALDTDRGLMVPVVKNAAHRGLLSIASEVTRLSELGRAGKASREDLTGSTITITSAGSIGGAFATPIINFPEVAIIGVYQIVDKPVVRDGQIVIRKMGFVSITLDHRVVDGGTAARVITEMKRLLGNPGLMMLTD